MTKHNVLSNCIFIRKLSKSSLLLSAVLLGACVAGDGTTDVFSPVVTTRSPQDGEINVPLDSTFSVSFDENLDSDTVETVLNPESPLDVVDNVRVLLNGSPIDGVVTYDASTFTATFTPDAPLVPDSIYVVQLFGGITDTGGNALDFINQFNASPANGSIFTTQEVVPPVVIDTNPNVGTDTASVAANIEVEFDEPIDASTLNDTTFMVLDAAGSPVAGTVAFEVRPLADGTNTYFAVFDPDTNLAFATEHTIVLAPGIADVTGNQLEGAENFSFITMQVPGPDDFGFSLASPAAGERDVAVAGTEITVEFDEAVDGVTVTGTSFNLLEGSIANGDTNIVGAVAVDGPTMATFTPDGCLPSDARLIVALTNDITNGGTGSLIPNEFEIFTESGFGLDERIDDPADPASAATNLALASDGAGRAMAVWLQEADDPVDGTADVLAAFFDVATCGWSVPQVLDNPIMGAALNPNVGSGSNGAFIATWEQATDLQFSVFDPVAATWSAPALVNPSPLLGTAALSALSVTSDGDALAVWLEGATAAAAGGGGGGAVDADVMASFYDQAAGTWSATETIAIPDTGDDLPITGLAADLDLAGNAIILYEQNSDDSDLDGDGDAETGAEEDILFSRFLNTGAAPVWSAPITLDFDPSDATGVTVEIEETTGDAILVWVQDNAVVDMGAVQELRVLALPFEAVPDAAADEMQFGFGGNPAQVSAVIGLDDEGGTNAFIVGQDPGAMGAMGAPGGVQAIQAIVVNNDIFTMAPEAEDVATEMIGVGTLADETVTPEVLLAEVDDLSLAFDAAGNPVATWAVEETIIDTSTGLAVPVINNVAYVTNTFEDGSWGFPVSALDENALTIVTESPLEPTDLEIVSGTGIGDILVRIQSDLAADGTAIGQVVGIRNGDNAE